MKWMRTKDNIFALKITEKNMLLKANKVYTDRYTLHVVAILYIWRNKIYFLWMNEWMNDYKSHRVNFFIKGLQISFFFICVTLQHDEHKNGFTLIGKNCTQNKLQKKKQGKKKLMNRKQKKKVNVSKRELELRARATGDLDKGMKRTKRNRT